MRHFKTSAIILDSVDVFDADRSFLLFTLEYGKLWARAKGVRRPSSKIAGHLLIYLSTQLEMVESSGWLLITQAELISKNSSTPYPENTLLFLWQASLIAESINRLFIDRDPHRLIYESLGYTLNRLGDVAVEMKVQLIVAEFLIKCLAELGYQPELQNCVVTGQKVSEKFVAWSSQAGGLVSEEGFRMSLGNVKILNSARSIVVLRQLMRPEFVAERLEISEEVQKEVILIIYDYLQTIIGQPLRSLIN